MPTKNTIKLSAGTFYLTPLEGGEPIPLGKARIVDATEQIERPEESDPFHPLPACRAAVNQELSFEIEAEPGEAWEAFKNLVVEPLREALAQLFAEMSRKYTAWCVENHPDWVRILRRTKKKRTRKKYMNRLYRAFLEEE